MENYSKEQIEQLIMGYERKAKKAKSAFKKKMFESKIEDAKNILSRISN